MCKKILEGKSFIRKSDHSYQVMHCHEKHDCLICVWFDSIKQWRNKKILLSCFAFSVVAHACECCVTYWGVQKSKLIPKDSLWQTSLNSCTRSKSVIKVCVRNLRGNFTVVCRCGKNAARMLTYCLPLRH